MKRKPTHNSCLASGGVIPLRRDRQCKLGALCHALRDSVQLDSFVLYEPATFVKPQNVSENALCTNSDITLSNKTQLPKVSNAINSIQTAGLVTVKQIIVLILK